VRLWCWVGPPPQRLQEHTPRLRTKTTRRRTGGEAKPSRIAGKTPHGERGSMKRESRCFSKGGCQSSTVLAGAFWRAQRGEIASTPQSVSGPD
jgi:hypothetical protein